MSRANDTIQASRTTQRMLRCAASGCRARVWAGTPFCFDHLLRHVARALRPEETRRLNERLEEVLRTLTYREREVLKLRFGSLPGDGFIYTRQEVGRIFKITASAVGRIEDRAFRKLCHPVRMQHLKEFVSVRGFDVPDQETIRAIVNSNAELICYLKQHPEHLYRIPPDAFERIIAEVFGSQGYQVEFTQQTRDGGRDVIAVSRSKFGIKTKHIIECKRFAPNRPVSVELVRGLYGVKNEQRADHAILATTSYFTADAVKFSKSPNVWNLHLKDFEAIQGWLTAYDEMMSRGAILL